MYHSRFILKKKVYFKRNSPKLEVVKETKLFRNELEETDARSGNFVSSGCQIPKLLEPVPGKIPHSTKMNTKQMKLVNQEVKSM